MGGHAAVMVPGTCGELVQVYDQREGFAKISPDSSEWVDVRYLRRVN